MNLYEIAYDMILDLQQELKTNMRSWNSSSVHALSAAYILQDYLAEKIATIGEAPEGEDINEISWEQIKEALAHQSCVSKKESP